MLELILLQFHQLYLWYGNSFSCDFISYKSDTGTHFPAVSSVIPLVREFILMWFHQLYLSYTQLYSILCGFIALPRIHHVCIDHVVCNTDCTYWDQASVNNTNTQKLLTQRIQSCNRSMHKFASVILFCFYCTQVYNNSVRNLPGTSTEMRSLILCPLSFLDCSRHDQWWKWNLVHGSSV